MIWSCSTGYLGILMKISRLDKYFINAGIRNWLIVKLTTDQGYTGYGEGSLEWQERGVEAILEEFGEKYVIGSNPFNIEDLFMRLYRGQYEGGAIPMTAISAVEIACWDIVGKVAGQPVYNLLGGKISFPLRAYANGWYGGDPRPMSIAKQAKEVVARGYTALKFDPFGVAWKELDHKGLESSLALVAAVRDTVGPNIDILIEGHGRLSFSSALTFAREVESLNPFWLEEPIAPESVELLSELRSKIHFRVAAGERMYAYSDFERLIALHAVDVLQFDVAHCGGILASKKIAAMAYPKDIMIAPHCSIGPVATAATLQLAVTLPNMLLQEAFDEFDVPWRGETVNGWKPSRDGFMYPSDMPGIGVEVNESVASHHPYRENSFPSLWDDKWYAGFFQNKTDEKGT
jgi:galactonate dehydratase